MGLDGTWQAGELGGAYFPNYTVAVSSAERGARNLALLTLATPVASLSAVLHGAFTDLYGFSASFVFGITHSPARALAGLQATLRGVKTLSD
jgi:hypothetical protein